MNSLATNIKESPSAFSQLAFSPSARPSSLAPLLKEEGNIIAMPIPEHVTFDKGRCAAFVDRLMTHYEDGKLKPKLMLSEDNQVSEIISITPVLTSASAAMLRVTCSNGDCKQLNISDNTHRLVQFSNHIERNGQKVSELCLGWEDRTDKQKSGFIHFEKSGVQNQQ